MQARIDIDEAYPVYYLMTDPEDLGAYPHCNLEVPDALVLRYQRVSKEYWALQDELEKLNQDDMARRRANRLGETGRPYVKENT